MRCGRQPNKPIYVTPKCGIEVIGESLHAATGRWRCYIRPHPLFSGVTVWRNRLVMTEHLGRRLSKNEHVHHKSEDRADDSLANLQILEAAEHNRHHKSGARHRPEVRKRIAASLRDAYRAGRRIVAGACATHTGRSPQSLEGN